MVLVTLACLALIQDDKDEAVAAAKKLGELKSYTFFAGSTTESTGGFGSGVQSAKSEGKYQSGVGTVILTDTMEYVKVGKTTVARPRGEWRIVEENPPEGGRRGERGMGGFWGQRGAPKAPHEELADLGMKIAKIKKLETDKVDTVWEIELTEDAAKELSSVGRMLDRMGGGDLTGKAELWVLGGAIVKYKITIRVEADLQGNAFEMTQTKTVTISNQGETKVEIPAEAKKVIDKAKREDF